MYMASYPILPPKPSGLFHLNSLQISSARIVINPLKHVTISKSGRRQRSSGIQAVESSGNGGVAEPNPVGPSSGGSSSPTPPPSKGFPPFNLSPWSGWFFGSFLFSAIPLCKNILTAEEKMEKMLAAAANTIEKAAERTDKMAEELVASLPEGDMKEMAHKIEKMAETVDKEAEAAQELIGKVDKLTDELNECMEPILGGNLPVPKIKTSTR